MKPNNSSFKIPKTLHIIKQMYKTVFSRRAFLCMLLGSLVYQDKRKRKKLGPQIAALEGAFTLPYLHLVKNNRIQRTIYREEGKRGSVYRKSGILQTGFTMSCRINPLYSVLCSNGGNISTLEKTKRSLNFHPFWANIFSMFHALQKKKRYFQL